MSNAVSNLVSEINISFRNDVLRKEADGEKQLDIRYENVTDKEITFAIRMGFRVCYNGMFQMYRLEWGRSDESK